MQRRDVRGDCGFCFEQLNWPQGFRFFIGRDVGVQRDIRIELVNLTQIGVDLAMYPIAEILKVGEIF